MQAGSKSGPLSSSQGLTGVSGNVIASNNAAPSSILERKPSSKSNRLEKNTSIEPKSKKEDKRDDMERKKKLNFYQQSEEGSSDNIHVNIAESDHINDSEDIIYQQKANDHHKPSSSQGARKNIGGYSGKYTGH